MTADEARLFEGAKPEVPATYAALLAAVRPFGPVGIEPKKTSIHLVSGSAFAGVHPQKGKMRLNIKADRPLDGARIRKVEQVSANRFHCEADLLGPSDVDAELIDWLREAYALSAKRS